VALIVYNLFFITETALNVSLLGEKVKKKIPNRKPITIQISVEILLKLFIQLRIF